MGAKPQVEAWQVFPQGGLNKGVKTGFNCPGQNLQNGQNWVKLGKTRFQYFVFHCYQLPQHIIHGVIMSPQSKCSNVMYKVHFRNARLWRGRPIQFIDNR